MEEPENRAINRKGSCDKKCKEVKSVMETEATVEAAQKCKDVSYSGVNVSWSYKKIIT